jgi:LPXTG-site transpeptidase (sortase) family protein
MSGSTPTVAGASTTATGVAVLPNTGSSTVLFWVALAAVALGLAVLAVSGAFALKQRMNRAAPTVYYRWGSRGSVPTHGLVSAAPAKQTSEPEISGNPVALSIPSLHKSLTVINGTYSKNSGQWTLTLDKAQYATPSYKPNNKNGNTLIYGHYRPEVFATLHTITPGAVATVTTDNGYEFIYKFTNTYATQPTDGSIFAYRGAPILTLQTCSGAWFQNRQMYQFSLVSYQKI